MKALREYQQFHGHRPRYSARVPFPDLSPGDTVVRLGRAVAIEYECDKLHGGGDGKMAVYRHDFETPVDLVSVQQNGKTWLFAHGKKLKVTRAGIEN